MQVWKAREERGIKLQKVRGKGENAKGTQAKVEGIGSMEFLRTVFRKTEEEYGKQCFQTHGQSNVFCWKGKLPGQKLESNFDSLDERL